MKLHCILFLSIYYIMPIQTEPFIHSSMVKTNSGLFIKLPDTFQEESFNVTYLPQQIITIHHNPKRIRCPLSKKTSYLKYRLESSKPYKEVELLIKKETVGSMKSLLNPSPHHIPLITNRVIRIYKKNEGTKNTWTPIITIPEKDSLTVFAHATVHSDGTIHF